MLGAQARASGARFSFHSSRATLHQVTEEALREMVSEGDRCARELSDARVDALVYACLIAIMAGGAGAHDAVEARLVEVAKENGSELPVISSAGALVRTLHRLEAHRVAIITPYLEPLTELASAYLRAHEIDVVDAVSLRVSDNVAVARLDPANLVPLARDLDTSRADAVIVSACVQMRSLPVIATVERELELPVISATTATVFELLERLGLEPRVPEAGSLLAGGATAFATHGG
jgi:maleate isomerase